MPADCLIFAPTHVFVWILGVDSAQAHLLLWVGLLWRGRNFVSTRLWFNLVCHPDRPVLPAGWGSNLPDFYWSNYQCLLTARFLSLHTSLYGFWALTPQKNIGPASKTIILLSDFSAKFITLNFCLRPLRYVCRRQRRYIPFIRYFFINFKNLGLLKSLVVFYKTRICF